MTDINNVVWMPAAHAWLPGRFAVAPTAPDSLPLDNPMLSQLLTAIAVSGEHAIAAAVAKRDLPALELVINRTNTLQIEAGLKPLPSALRATAYMYFAALSVGSALYLFDTAEDCVLFCTGGKATQISEDHVQ